MKQLLLLIFFKLFCINNFGRKIRGFLGKTARCWIMRQRVANDKARESDDPRALEHKKLKIRNLGFPEGDSVVVAFLCSKGQTLTISLSVNPT